MANPVQSIDELVAVHSDPGSGFDEVIDEVVSRYFASLNAANYHDAAQLFAENGTLYPPFESAIVGTEAITHYLETEAQGMRLTPLQSSTERMDDGTVQQHVTGKVTTSLFTVSVSWNFVLSPAAEILAVEVKLLAGLPELLNLKKDAG